MLTALHVRGEIAVAGRRSGQRLWDLAERWLPATETAALKEAERVFAERRFRSQGVRLRYRLEMFVPRAKREYGYYVPPLLAGDRVVGRAEPRFDRKTKELALLGAWGDTSRLDEALTDLAAWLGADSIA